MSKSKTTTRTLWLTRDAWAGQRYRLWEEMPKRVRRVGFSYWNHKTANFKYGDGPDAFMLPGLSTLRPGGGPAEIRVTVEVVKR